MKTVAILGSTGSIGINALAIAEEFRHELRVTGLSTNSNINLLREQVRAFAPTSVAVLNEAAGREFEREMRGVTRVFVGEQGLEEFAVADRADIVLNALVGFAGLRPTMRAIRDGRTIALANKETLVVAGELIRGLMEEFGVAVHPIDSEHSAIWQCLVGEESASIRRLILTASGGPFRTVPEHSFDSITVEQALNHPNWKMGRKITIDSATLMNKGLEVHEARWLFDIPGDRIDVVIHPQSIVHSMVEFQDGSVKAQLGVADMKLPILYALLYPQRGIRPGGLSIDAMSELTFSTPDRSKFPCLQLAFDALAAGGTAPAALNAANEVAVEAFLQRKIRFTDIPSVVADAIARNVTAGATFDNIVHADGEARRVAADSVAARTFIAA